MRDLERSARRRNGPFEADFPEAIATTPWRPCDARFRKISKARQIAISGLQGLTLGQDEEPELGLHTALVSRLPNLVVCLYRRSPRQLLITTQLPSRHTGKLQSPFTEDSHSSLTARPLKSQD